MKKKFLVTGGAGYKGSHVVRLLLEKKYDVLVFDNFSTGNKFACVGVPYIEGDLTNKEQIDDTLRSYKPDVVIHFAANAYVGESVSDPLKYYKNNIGSGLNLLELMIKNNTDKIIFSSSCAVYGIPETFPIDESTEKKPINPYGKTKHMFEEILQDFREAYGLKFISLRYFNAAGAHESGTLGEWHEPETHFIPLLMETVLGRRKELKIYGNDYDTPDGTCIRDYVHVMDLAEAHIKAAELLFHKDSGEYLNIGAEKGTSVLEIIKKLESLLNIDIKFCWDERRIGDPAKLVANCEKARNVLKWKPQYSDLEHILLSAYNWHKRRERTKCD